MHEIATIVASKRNRVAVQLPSDWAPYSHDFTLDGVRTSIVKAIDRGLPERSEILDVEGYFFSKHRADKMRELATTMGVHAFLLIRFRGKGIYSLNITEQEPKHTKLVATHKNENRGCKTDTEVMGFYKLDIMKQVAY